VALFLISVFSLFLELLLIRWVTTEVRVFAYLQNTVLVVCFLGLGVGCFTAYRPARLRNSLIPLLILTGLISIPYVKDLLAVISPMLSVLEDFVIWFEKNAATTTQATASVAVGLTLTLVLVALIWEIFLPLGRILGSLMDASPNTVVAYTINIAGSLVGVLFFAAISAFSLPPFAWFAPAALLAAYFVFREQRDRKLNVMLLVATTLVSGLASVEPGAERVYWSPYQKLVLRSGVRSSENRIIDLIRGRKAEGQLSVWSPQTNGVILVQGDDYQRFLAARKYIAVNNVGYQELVDLSPGQAATYPDLYPPEMLGLSQYHIPSKLHPNPQNVLIVGGGSGNDAAGALATSEAMITAVEIDPVIVAIGKENHPNRPYHSPRVRVVIDDARSFFATTDERYDVISFGLLDSHTTTAMTNARLDHYVYTEESIDRARQLLKPGGIITLSFEAQKFHIADRIARSLNKIFGTEPLAFRVPFTGYGWGGLMFVAGDLDGVRQQRQSDERLDSIIQLWSKNQPFEFSHTTKLATDDWPYIYLQTPRIPSLY
jgi:spermidine synthase